MHSFLRYLSLAVVVSSALCAAPSNPPSLPGEFVNVTSVAGTIDPDHVSVTFSVPVKDSAEPLELTLTVGVADQECRDVNLHINEETLALGNPQNERTLFTAPHLGEYGPWYQAEGSLSCLGDDEVSMVHLRIYSLDIEPSIPISALAFSYKQVGEPSLLRLSYGVPRHMHDLPALSLGRWKSWVNPADDVKVSIHPIEDTFEDTVNGHANSSDLPEGLEAQLLRLELLKAHADDIQAEIKATEDRLMAMWKSDFAKCNSITCYVKTAVTKAPKFAHLLASHLSHHSHIDADFFKNSTHMNCTMEVEKVVSQHEQQMVLTDLGKEPESAEDATVEAGVAAVDDEAEAETAADEAMAEDSSDATAEDDSSKEEGDAADTPPSDEGRPRWRHGPPGGWGGHGGPPPWAKPGGRPPWAQGDKPPFGRPPWARPGGRRPWATEENHTPGASGPTDADGKTDHSTRFELFTLTPQDRFKIAFIIAATFLIGLFVLSLACCICIRRGVRFLRDPRRKADCAARREERRTKALYRKAAYKHRVRTFFQRLRRPFSSVDYEEKHEYLLNQAEEGEDSYSDVMRPQINSLRRMHAMLSTMMRARDAPASQTADETQSPALAELDAAERASVTARSETLPAYESPPPSYRAGLGSEFSVVTGFTGFTRSRGSSSGAPTAVSSTAEDAAEDDRTESSVVDCSPRLSLDSQRTATTRSRE